MRVIPDKDLLGIRKIRIAENFSHKKCNNNSLGCYIPDQKGTHCIIEINIINLLKKKIPKYLFELYPEIAALFLSEVIAHEIGHHVHTFKRTGITKRSHEKFANKYAIAGYSNYLISRQSTILSSYKWASWNLFMFNKQNRRAFSSARCELINWIENNKRGIPFP
ncbi:MAG: hypothetical protein GY754_41095 [bacterium]|nr:hypothetical protein [bacterium]